MLADKDAMATIAVRDLAAAKNFYQQKLGFSPTGPEGDGVVTLRSGNSTFIVYELQFAGTNKATSATWGSAQKWTPSCKPLKRQVLLSNIMIRRTQARRRHPRRRRIEGSLVQGSRRQHPAYQQSVKSSKASRGLRFGSKADMCSAKADVC